MKRSNFVKLAFVLMAIFAFTELNAQILVKYSEDNSVTNYQTAGKNFKLYVMPDPVYSNTYAAATNTNINAGSLWTWNLGGLTAAAPWVDNTTAIAFNTVTVTAPVAGTYTVTAAEQFGAAGCVDATPTSQTVTVLPVPSASIAGAAVEAGWTVGTAGAGHEYYKCNVGVGEDITVTFAEAGVPLAYAWYAFSITKEVTGYNALGAVVVGPTTTTPVDETLGSKIQGAAGGGTYVYSTGALTFVQLAGVDVRTKYVYTLKKASDAPGAEGIVSMISHKSDDEGGAVVTHPFTGDVTVTYWLNLPPVTGPIYHLPNNYTF